jgi:predicted lipid carrier protein YhbT
VTKVDFSLNLILGLLVANFDNNFLNKFSKFAIKNMFVKHPKIFNKISSDSKDVLIAISPVDIPYIFMIIINNHKPDMFVVKSNSKIYFDAKITGNLKDLLMLFEGKIDGDAAFFSQKLKIEGNTTLILKIRNAIDSEEIDILKDFSESLFLFDKALYKILQKSLKKYNSINDKIIFIFETIISKNIDMAKYNSYKIYELEESLKRIEKKLNKDIRGDIRKKSDYLPKNVSSYKDDNTNKNIEENDDGYV